MPGFDYQLGRAVKYTRPEWYDMMRAELKKGGFRRAEGGETFIHNQHGRIVFEVYLNIDIRGNDDDGR